jgi:hypothetical protein
MHKEQRHPMTDAERVRPRNQPAESVKGSVALLGAFDNGRRVCLAVAWTQLWRKKGGSRGLFGTESTELSGELWGSTDGGLQGGHGWLLGIHRDHLEGREQRTTGIREKAKKGNA